MEKSSWSISGPRGDELQALLAKEFKESDNAVSPPVGSAVGEPVEVTDEAAPIQSESAASLSNLLDSEDSKERITALRALTQQGAKASVAVPKLIELLDQPDAVEKVWAVRCLGHIGPKAAAAGPKLLEILKSGVANLPKGQS